MSTEQTSGQEPSVATRWQVAVHEAAHAAYAHRQGIAVSYVTIKGIVAVENGVAREYGASLGRCYTDWDGESEGAYIGLLGCVLSLVGPAAAHKTGWRERVLLPYEEFVQVAEEAHPRSDAGCVLTKLRQSEHPEALYEAARIEAEAFVENSWTEIVALAERLMEKEALGASDVSAVLGPGWLEFREMLDEMTREDDLAPWVKAAGGIENVEWD